LVVEQVWKIYILPLPELELGFFGHEVPSLVTVPTELSLLQSCYSTVSNEASALIANNPYRFVSREEPLLMSQVH
jgi:hypothetical protein